MSGPGLPVAGVDYPRTYQQLQEWFPDDAACLEYLEGLRWPDGFVCPHCGGTKAWRIARRGMWMCTECGKQTSVTAGTIFHRSHTPLSVWFAAIWYVCATKNGISASSLQQILGFGSYETAWAWLHKLRRAMVRPDRELLSGTVELDVAMVGGRTKGKQGAATHKVPVMIAVEVLEGRRVGRIRLARASKPSSGEPVEFAERVVQAGSHVRTDGAIPLRRLTEKGFTHEAHVMVSAKEPAHELLPGVHIVASLLKRWISGTLHHGIAKPQLDYYLDEYTFRFNRRHSRSRGLLFYRLLQQAVATDPQPLTSLIGGVKPI
jgi:transposase-like protein